MRAVVLEQPGGLERLHLVDRPDPGEPGPGDVRVRVHATTINYHDLGVAMGHFPAPPHHVPLADGGGVVEATGPGVTDLVPGDRVVSVFFPWWQSGAPTRNGLDQAPGLGTDGHAQEVVVRPASWYSRAPRNHTHAEAASVTVAGVTAWNALTGGGLLPGETVLVLGTGGVSLYALQFAKAAGARVIATSSSDEKLERLRALGADEVVNYRQEPEWGRRAVELTDGRGVDRVVEVGGPATLPQSIAAVRVGGHISLVGVLTGFAGEIPTDELMMKQAVLRGVVVGSRAHHDEAVRAIDAADIHPPLDTEMFDLAQLAEAYRRHASQTVVGKVTVSL